MKVISKLYLALALTLGLSTAFAEDSGSFMGFGVGYGGIEFKAKASGALNGTATYNGGGVTLGIIGGYKQFFTRYVGLRYYANVDSVISDLKPDTMAKYIFGTSREQATLINFGINVDFLANFVSNGSVDFGAFVGLGLGGNWWFGSGVEKLDDVVIGATTSKIGFDLALNAGLRINIATNHGIEVAARIPFIKTTMLDEDVTFLIVSNSTGNIKMKAHNVYRIIARYTYSY